jgi:hypothetical protein
MERADSTPLHALTPLRAHRKYDCDQIKATQLLRLRQAGSSLYSGQLLRIKDTAPVACEDRKGVSVVFTTRDDERDFIKSSCGSLVGLWLVAFMKIVGRTNQAFYHLEAQTR